MKYFLILVVIILCGVAAAAYMQWNGKNYVSGTYVMYGSGTQPFQDEDWSSISAVLTLTEDGQFFFQRTQPGEGQFLDFPDYQYGEYSVKKKPEYWVSDIFFTPHDDDSSSTLVRFRFTTTLSSLVSVEDVSNDTKYYFLSSVLSSRYNGSFFKSFPIDE